ncbi:MAG: 3-isopropylmalate dehydratase large subunit [Puniceicoccales bacterium]|jgi:3-isopropylmalate/(R)-2-methylmalate dehydratase large subunit|nr:3-isopropylmalate dehydratase large subunit [Puniceicoccales bacterium]
MSATLVEKLIARRLNRDTIAPGEIIELPVDRLMINDYVGCVAFSTLAKMGLDRILRPERVLVALDHSMPAFSVDAADKQVFIRQQCARLEIENVGFLGKHGIGHQLMVEDFTRPYEIAVGTDSHATMYGGLGAFSFGITVSDAISALVTGNIWVKVPESLKIQVNGSLPIGVVAKDLSLALLNVFDSDRYIYRAVEIVGETIDTLNIDGRLIISNMIAEADAKCAVFEADAKAFAFTGAPIQDCISADSDAIYVDQAYVDATQLEPLLSYPHSVKNVKPLSYAKGISVDQVFIGSCTNGRLEDLQQAAEILKGKKVAKGTRLIVVPASQTVAREATRLGIIGTLMEAGAAIMTSSCCSCAGHGPGLIGNGECCVSTTNRNFQGRMGSMDADIFLGSAYTAAAAALTGHITDPRELLY